MAVDFASLWMLGSDQVGPVMILSLFLRSMVGKYDCDFFECLTGRLFYS